MSNTANNQNNIYGNNFISQSNSDFHSDDLKKRILRELVDRESSLPITFDEFKKFITGCDEYILMKECYKLHKIKYIDCLTADGIDNAPENWVWKINHITPAGKAYLNS